MTHDRHAEVAPIEKVEEAKSNPIVDEFLRNRKMLMLNQVDLSNMNNLFVVINSIKEVELAGEKEVLNLEHCKLGHKNIEKLYDVCANDMRNPFHLCLSWNKLGEKGIVPAKKLFTPTTNMSRLYLDGNDIGDTGMKLLMRAMEVGRARITHLSLNLNNIKREGMQCLAEKFSVALSCLTHLSIGKNDLSDPATADLVAHALSCSTTLQEVDFSDTRLGSAGAITIAEHLINQNRTLLSLDLTLNNIRDEGAKAVALALESNVTLSTLRLGSNNIGPAGCVFFVEALSLNETLRTLDLSRTHAAQVPLGVEGARHIAHILAINRGLTDLNLYWCQLESEGALLLVSALEDNKTITKINLGGNFIGPAAVRRLEECMSPMYQPRHEVFGLSSWDSQTTCTPLILNRKTKLASRRPKSAAPVLSVPPSVKNRRHDHTINVNSRKSVSVTRSSALRLGLVSAAPARVNIKELFAITIPSKAAKENSAMLPAIRSSLDVMELVLVKGRHQGMTPQKVLRQLKNNWVSDSITISGKKGDSRIDKLFQM